MSVQLQSVKARAEEVILPTFVWCREVNIGAGVDSEKYKSGEGSRE